MSIIKRGVHLGMKINNKVFVVTGGGSGVGRELVINLLARGARVAAVDINQEALEEVANHTGGSQNNLSIHAVNVAVRESVEALPEQVTACHHVVDGIINNAGIIQPFLGLYETGYDIIQKVFNVNLNGTLYMTKAFLPYLKARPEAYIANVSSCGALTPFPGETIYGASKAAVKILTEGLYSELQNSKVRVMVVFPGGINSNILDNSGIETDQRMVYLREKFAFLLLTPQKAAKIIIRGIERNRYRLTPGLDATLVDFFCRLSPTYAPRLIYKVINSVLQQ